VLPVINASVPGTVYIGRLGGTLFTNITLDSLDIRAPDGTRFVQTGPLQLSYSPRALLAGRLMFRFVSIQRPVVHLVDYGDDDWNWKRALRKEPRPSRLPLRTRRVGDWIRIDSAEVIEAAVSFVDEWRPADSLRGARRDSSIRYHLARRDLEVRRDGDRLVKIRRWLRGYVALGRSQLAHPDSAGLRLTVRRVDVVETDPLFWFRNTSGQIRIAGDSLWIDSARVHLPRSGGRAEGKIVWGSKLPVRWDLRIAADSVAFTDIAWIDETLPQVGGGRTALHIRNDPRNLAVLEYVLTDMDARALRSRLTGRMTFGVGDTVLRITDMSVEARPLHTDMLRWMNGGPFPYDWRGAITGRIQARGGPVTRFMVDDARLTYTDEHVDGAVSRGVIRGAINVLRPGDATFLGTVVELAPLDLRTPRYVNPTFPDMRGVIAGRMVLDSVWTDVRFSRAQIVHRDGASDTSALSGTGRITMRDADTFFDVDLAAAPLSFSTLAQSYAVLPLRGRAVGPIRARGTSADFQLNTALAGAGGEVAYAGMVDTDAPEYRATGAMRLTGIDVRTLFADSTLPPTAFGADATIDMRGVSLATLTGTVAAALSERSSRVGSVPVYGARVDARFGNEQLVVDSVQVESAAFRADARGVIGLTAVRRDTLRVTLAADSLGGVRDLAQWLRLIALRSDSVAPVRVDGTMRLEGRVVASLDTADREGVAVELSATARELMVGTVAAARGRVSLSLRDAMRRASGRAVLALDSVRSPTIDADALSANILLRDALPAAFRIDLRTPSQALVAAEGSSTRDRDTVTVRLDSLNVRIPAATLDGNRTSSAHGFALAAPVTLRIGPTRAPLPGDMASRSIDLVDFTWRHSDGGVLTASGRVDERGRVAASIRATRLPLDDVGAFVRPANSWRGWLDATASLRGRRDDPEASVSLTLRDGRIGAIGVPRLMASGDYAGQRLLAQLAIAADANGTRTLANGLASLPVDLALQRVPKRLLDAPLSGRLTADGIDLGLLNTVFPTLQEGRGVLQSNVVLSGTWEQPRFDGALAISNGSLAVSDLGVRVEELFADIRLAGDSVQIRRLSARSGSSRTDTLSLSGTIQIPSARDPVFDLRLAANNFLAIDLPRTATLSVSTLQPVTLRGPRRTALVDGALRLDRGRVVLNSLSQRRPLDVDVALDVIDTAPVAVDAFFSGVPSALVQGLTVDDLRLEIGDDVWLRSPEANIKLGGTLRLARAVDPRDGRARLALADSVVVQRGTYQLNLGLARPTFDVERGTIRFFGDPDIDPSLDIAALHVVRQQRANSNRQDVRIRVRLGGTLSQPTLTLSSADNPPLPESDMLSYLVTGEPAYALFGTTYADQGATLALRLAGSYLSSRLAGGRFDLVQVEPTALNPGEASNLRQSGLGILAATRIGVGGQLGTRTFVSVTTGLCGLAPQGGNTDPLSLFAQGLGVKLERQFERSLSASFGIEPGSSAQTCGRLGASRTFQQIPPQLGFDLFRNWSW
jgi:translocation and assembly module TamB